jgi:L-alanine-DL-glutamate epimerase-like enolase superfamily enzyme
MKKIAALAEAHYIGMAPHNPNGPLATAINVQFAATIPNFMMLETVGSVSDQKLEQALVRNPLRFEDGCLRVPETIGYGIEMDEEAFARFPYVPHEGFR